MSKRAPDGITTVKQAGKKLEIIFGDVVFRPTGKSVFKERNLVFIFKRESEAEVKVTDYQHPEEIWKALPSLFERNIRRGIEGIE